MLSCLSVGIWTEVLHAYGMPPGLVVCVCVCVCVIRSRSCHDLSDCFAWNVPSDLAWDLAWGLATVSVSISSSTSRSALHFAYAVPELKSFALSVFWNGSHVSGSPFTVAAYASVEVR